MVNGAMTIDLESIFTIMRCKCKNRFSLRVKSSIYLNLQFLIKLLALRLMASVDFRQDYKLLA